MMPASLDADECMIDDALKDDMLIVYAHLVSYISIERWYAHQRSNVICSSTIIHLFHPFIHACACVYQQRQGMKQQHKPCACEHKTNVSHVSHSIWRSRIYSLFRAWYSSISMHVYMDILLMYTWIHLYIHLLHTSIHLYIQLVNTCTHLYLQLA